MTHTDRNYWFNVAETPGLGPAAAQKVARYLADHRLGASALVGVSADFLQRDVGLPVGVASALEVQLRQPLALPELPDGAELLTPDDEHFPVSRFLEANPPLPPVLWATAETSLLTLSGPSLAVAGSRDTTDEVIEVVAGLTRAASRRGWVVVSGLAHGVDSAAHRGAMEGGAGTIGVLASGLLNSSRSWMPSDLDGMCVVSQFRLHEPWSGPRAMQRNSTIAGLADRVLVAAAGTSGGSWEMAQLCIKRRKPLFVLDLPAQVAAGNAKLIKAGATPLAPDGLDTLLAQLAGPLNLFG